MSQSILLPALAKPKFIFSAGAALAATSQVVGIFGTVENALSNQRSLEYLEKLSSDIQDIKVTLSAVLDKLDKLTVEIRSIVKEEVNQALLKEKYIELDSLLMRFFVDAGEKKLSQSASERLDYILLFLCNCENRLSYMLDFIRACEIAMLLSKGKHRKYVQSVVLEKISLITPLGGC